MNDTGTGTVRPSRNLKMKLSVAALAGGWIFLRNPALATMVAAAFTEKSHRSRRRR